MSLLLLFGGGGVPADMSAKASSVMVAGSLTYTATASFRAATDARSCRVLIRWYDGSNAYLSATTGASVSDSTSAWTSATASDTSPAGAVYAIVVAEVLGATGSEVHYVDKIGLFQGTSPTWAPHQPEPFGSPVASLLGAAASDGVLPVPARADHVHDRQGDAALYWMQVGA